jgi:intein/homing endonuclease
MNRPNFQQGDIAVKWLYKKNVEKKETFTNKALIDDLTKRQKALNSTLTIGCVVKSKLSDIIMTVVWIIGTPKEPTAIFDPNEIYKQSGQLKDGDIICVYEALIYNFFYKLIFYIIIFLFCFYVQMHFY